MKAREFIDRILSLQKKKDFRGAFNILQEALSIYPSNTFLLTSEIYLLLRLKRLKEARQKAEARFDSLKTNPFFLRTYIEILLKENEKEEFMRLSERLNTIAIRDEKLYLFIARSLIKLGEREKAIGILNSGLLYMPGSRELNSLLDRLKEEPHEAGINYYRERYRDIPTERAISEIENILFLPDFEGDISIRLFLAELYKKRGLMEKAAEIYTECLKIKDSPHVRRMLGFLYYRMEDMDRAFFYLRDALIETPEDYAIYNTISKIIERTDNLKEIESTINEALSRHPEARHLYGLLKRLRKRIS